MPLDIIQSIWTCNHTGLLYYDYKKDQWAWKTNQVFLLGCIAASLIILLFCYHNVSHCHFIFTITGRFYSVVLSLKNLSVYCYLPSLKQKQIFNYTDKFSFVVAVNFKGHVNQWMSLMQFACRLCVSRLNWTIVDFCNNNDLIFLQKLYSYFNSVILTNVQYVFFTRSHRFCKLNFSFSYFKRQHDTQGLRNVLSNYAQWQYYDWLKVSDVSHVTSLFFRKGN